MTKPPAPCLFNRRLTRIVVMWLLAAVLPLQGAAVGVFSALGPAHGHRVGAVQALPASSMVAAAAALPAMPPVLEDLRRWRPAPAAGRHVFAAVGHFHGSVAPERHHHRSDDASVEHVSADNGVDADEASVSGAVAMLAPLPGSSHGVAEGGAGMPAMRPPWTLRTGFTQPLDRPPKRA